MKQQIKTQLDNLAGKDWMYNGKVYHVEFCDYDDEADFWIIKATNRRFKFCSSEIEGQIRQFLPVADDKEIDKHVTDLTMMPDKAQFIDLKDTILDNIKSVRADKSYIKQADSICKSVNTLINMARLELQYIREQRRAN